MDKNIKDNFIPGVLNPTLREFDENETFDFKNNMEKIPKFPSHIRQIIMQWEFITLVNLPKSLEYLECRYCELDELPPLPATLKVLIVDNNNLKKLPPLPPTLEFLHCPRNKIIELPELPPTLKYLHCGYNKLTSIAQLPNSLIRFLYYENPIKAEPIIPTSVKYINDD